MLRFRKIRKAEVLVARLFLKAAVESHVETKNAFFLRFSQFQTLYLPRIRSFIKLVLVGLQTQFWA